MEGRKKQSLATDLFGEKDSPTAGSSSGFFGSIFGTPPNKAYGREHPPETENNTGNPTWKAKTDGNAVGGEGQSKGGSTSRGINSYFQDEKVQPFHYSSSIYYGGQDVYNPPPETAKTGPVFTTFNKDGGEDDSAGASRGNWWQGSLYY